MARGKGAQGEGDHRGAGGGGGGGEERGQEDSTGRTGEGVGPGGEGKGTDRLPGGGDEGSSQGTRGKSRYIAIHSIGGIACTVGFVLSWCQPRRSRTPCMCELRSSAVVWTLESMEGAVCTPVHS